MAGLIPKKPDKSGGHSVEQLKYLASTFATPSVSLRKTLALAVSNSAAETDLLNSEFTLVGGVLGTTKALRLSLTGNVINNTGGAVAIPRFKLKLGTTTLIDTNVLAAAWASSAISGGFFATIEIRNLGSAGSQAVKLDLDLADSFNNNIFAFATTGTGVFATNASDLAKAVITNGTSVDTTVSQVLAFTVTLPAANAALGITLTSALAEIL
jgi:hypothetical protein